MKTLLISFVLFFAMQISMASPVVLKQYQIEDAKKTIAKKISDDFPKHLVNDSKSAEVIFSVNQEGEIFVKQVNHVDSNLAVYIKEKLEGTVIESIRNATGKTFSIVLNLMMY